MIGGKFLGAGVDAVHSLQRQGRADLPEEVDALAQTVQQRQVEVWLHDSQHHAGEACAGADIDGALAPQVRHGQQGGAVQQVQRGHLLRCGDGG